MDKDWWCLMLQQPATFKKLPGILRTLFLVAGLAGDNQVVNAVSSIWTRKGKRMVNMVLAPGNMISAVVALFLLSEVLFLHLLCCMSSWRGKLPSTPPSLKGGIQITVLSAIGFTPCTSLLWVSPVMLTTGSPIAFTVGNYPGVIPFSNLFFMFLVVVFARCSQLLFVSSVVSPITPLRCFTMCLSIRLTSGKAFFQILCSIVFRKLSETLPALTSSKVSRSIKFDGVASRAASISFWNVIGGRQRVFLSIQSTAYCVFANYAEVIQAIRFLLMNGKKVFCGGFPLLTLWAMFQRGRVRIHAANCLSLVPWSSRCQAGKATRFSQRFMTPLLDSALSIPFFLHEHVAEMGRV